MSETPLTVEMLLSVLDDLPRHVTYDCGQMRIFVPLDDLRWSLGALRESRYTLTDAGRAALEGKR